MAKPSPSRAPEAPTAPPPASPTAPPPEASHLTRQIGALDATLRFARGQDGVFSVAQAEAHGFTGNAVRKQLAAGRLYRIYRGVYSAVPPELLSRRGRFRAAVLACGPGAVLSHRSAAALHGLRPTSRAMVDVTVVSHRHPAGIDAHRTDTLTSADVTEIDGIPCTSIARTLLDLAGVVSGRELERALEQAEILERLDVRALIDQVERHPTRTGAAALKALTQHAVAAPTERELEERLLAVCRDAHLPEPERQVYLDPGDGGPMLRADFVWRDQKLIVETDGRRFHSTRAAFERDRRRDQRLTRAGWRVVRITWRQLVERPQEVIELLADLLRPA